MRIINAGLLALSFLVLELGNTAGSSMRENTLPSDRAQVLAERLRATINSDAYNGGEMVGAVALIAGQVIGTFPPERRREVMWAFFTAVVAYLEGAP